MSKVGEAKGALNQSQVNTENALPAAKKAVEETEESVGAGHVSDSEDVVGFGQRAHDLGAEAIEHGHRVVEAIQEALNARVASDNGESGQEEAAGHLGGLQEALDKQDEVLRLQQQAQDEQKATNHAWAQALEMQEDTNQIRQQALDGQEEELRLLEGAGDHGRNIRW